MKRLIFASATLIAAIFATEAKTASQIRVYINPGHGSWTSNDRPCKTIGRAAYTSTGTDSTGFFESNTNLQKAFGCLERLKVYGLSFDKTLNQSGNRWEIGAAKSLKNNIVLSRVKNGPYESKNTTSSSNYMLYNRSLSVIASEVNSNNFDMFISIHSDAATEGTKTNFPTILYRGTDAKENVAGSKSMATKAWARHFTENVHQPWSSTSTRIRGDISFYNSSSTYGYLGVLKHNAPGFLIEGYFHTYQPSRQRAMNWDANRMEGISYARGIADYFGINTESTGDLYGIVRGKGETYSQTLYTPNSSSKDIYKPLNGVKVTLKNASGTTIGTYTTDKEWNGVFCFYKLTPGTYTITCTADGYKDLTTTATVTKGKTAQPQLFMEAGSNAPLEPYTRATIYSPKSGSTISGNYIDFICDKTGADATTLEIATEEDDFSARFFTGVSNWETCSTDASRLSYTLPVVFFPNGTYYWRVRTSKEGYLDQTSWVGSFTVNNSISTSEDYTLVHENAEFPILKSANGTKLKLVNLWCRTDVHGSSLNYDFSDNFNRDFAVKLSTTAGEPDIVYLTSTDSIRSSDQSHQTMLLRFDALSGETLSPLPLTFDDNYYRGTFTPLNGVVVDNAGHLIVHNLKVTKDDLLSFAIVSPKTGKCTTVFTMQQHDLVTRVDHVAIYGDITKDAKIFAGIAKSNFVWRWKVVDGKVTGPGGYNYTEHAWDNSSRIHAFSDDSFMIDDYYHDVEHYEFGNQSPTGKMSQSPNLTQATEPIGGNYFEMAGSKYLVHPTQEWSDGFKFRIAEGNNLPSDFTGLKELAVFPSHPSGLGGQIPKSGDVGADAEFLAVNPTTTRIYTYVPMNGLACYELSEPTSSQPTSAEAIGITGTKIFAYLQSDAIRFTVDVDEAKIYDLTGHMIAYAKNTSAINRPSAGIYIVTYCVNGNAYAEKIAVN